MGLAGRWLLCTQMPRSPVPTERSPFHFYTHAQTHAQQRTERLVRRLERRELVVLDVLAQLGCDVEEVRVVVCCWRLDFSNVSRASRLATWWGAQKPPQAPPAPPKKHHDQNPSTKTKPKTKQNKTKRTAEVFLAEGRRPARLELPGVVRAGRLVHVRGVVAPALEQVDLHLWGVGRGRKGCVCVVVVVVVRARVTAAGPGKGEAPGPGQPGWARVPGSWPRWCRRTSRAW